jgi:hypothetical protein
MPSEKRNRTLPDVIDDPVLGRLAFSANAKWALGQD